MSESPSSTSNSPPTSPAWIRHFPAILYGWFFFGLFLCGLLAPEERVLELESKWVTEGWRLSAMALVFGGGVLTLYILRVSGRWR